MRNGIVCSNRCNICFFEGKTQSGILLTCQRCKLLSYCGTSHQAIDWGIHKKFCKAVYTILKSKQIDHPHLIHGPINSKLDFQKAIINLKRLISESLNRNLEPHEEEYISCPRYCNKCLNLKTSKNHDCPNCNITAYCCSNCQQNDSSMHLKDCNDLKIYYNFWQDRDSPVNFNLKNGYLNVNWKLMNLFSLLKNISTNKIDIPNIIHDQISFQHFANACDFSCVSTILFVLNYCQFMHNLNNSSVIYIVGARDDFHFFQEHQCKFLISQMQNVSKLNLFFVGPQLLKTETRTYAYISDDGKKDINLEFFKQNFEDYIQTKKFDLNNDVFANLIICFNCGFSEFSNSKWNTWRQALDVFLKIQRTPIAFTSYTQLESKLDLKEICLADTETTAQIMIRCEKNPFRDYRPIRNWELSDECDNIFHRNNYLSVVMPKPHFIQAQAKEIQILENEQF